MRMRTVFLSSLGLFWFCFLFGCGKPSSHSAVAVEDCSLALYMGEYSVLFLVAEQQGYFLENGVHPVLTKTDAGAIALSQLLENKVDFACCADSAFVSRSFEEDRTAIIATLAEADSHEVVARKDRGISSPSDLAGKRIGYTPKTSGEFFLRTFLAFQRVPVNATNPIPLQPQEILSALERGDIDAASSWDVYVDQMKQTLKDNAVSWPSQNGQHYYWLLLTNRNTIQTKPALAEKLLRSLVQAEEFIRRNQEEAKNVLIQKNGRRRDYIDTIWPKMRLNVALPQELIVLMEDEASFLRQTGNNPSQSIPDYLARIDQSILQTVKPKGITIYQ